MAKRSLLSCPVVRDAVLVLGQLVREARVARRWTRDGRTGEKEQRARYVTSPDVLDVLRRHGPTRADPSPELFARIAFTKAISNSDDHARNHAAFWDGHHRGLIPAYDLAPGNRSGETASAKRSGTADPARGAHTPPPSSRPRPSADSTSGRVALSSRGSSGPFSTDSTTRSSRPACPSGIALGSRATSSSTLECRTTSPGS
ncbi:hypothetical protein C5C20_06525 [Rathayibacter rathayi]|nr:hypothetical protein C5C20_06525 [Rathayibacter rathayi]PPI75657.1 hypothetical protein C5E12_00460 [Rathayibacter rathayi]